MKSNRILKEKVVLVFRFLCLKQNETDLDNIKTIT